MRLRGIWHEVRGGPAILRGVDLDLSPGERVALLGRNGAGKSSLVRCLLGHQRPSAGAVRLFGRDIWRERTALMQRVGVVPEEPDATSTPEETPEEAGGTLASDEALAALREKLTGETES